MPSFSNSDINEAKRRVQEMQNKARQFTDEPIKSQAPIKKNESKEIIESAENDKSSLVILALILLLSSEEADNMLILALLYLLF